ncbi:MAG TPA: hypothetical protein ENH55_15465 [Aurantimonas coralicida]|uniref:BrnA antitoxin family protein n=2 Tax=root TaxID=1 RepID=A0A9C9THV0_9HYPH|nr:hypothetical protein [Aurantimonas coralicida]HEU01081.1 hypothetical protein [Aurantimonas coralicida]
MTAKLEESAAAWVDPDDAPAWTDAMLDRAELAEGGQVIRPATGTVARGRGRPPSENPKTRLTIRLDAEIVRHFRATGPGWQSRINDALKELVRRG